LSHHVRESFASPIITGGTKTARRDDERGSPGSAKKGLLDIPLAITDTGPESNFDSQLRKLPSQMSRIRVDDPTL